MAEYLPVKDDGDELTLVAGATIVGGQALYLSAANTVSPTTGALASYIGIAGYDASSGDNVTVYTRVNCVHEVTASGSIAAGNLLETAASGQVAAHTLGTNDGNVIGVALTAATNGNKVRFLHC